MGFHQLDRVEHYLGLWAAYMRVRVPENGYPSKIPGWMCGGSVSSLDDLIEQCEDESVRIVDGLIESLAPIQRCAVLNRWGLQRVWRSARDLDLMYELAKGEIERGLNKWGLP